MIVDFVNNRGGGFLMLGGKNSFSGGKYQTSSIADILPVDLTNDKLNVFQVVKVMLTNIGKNNALTKLAPEPAANTKAWADLPSLGDLTNHSPPRRVRWCWQRVRPKAATIRSCWRTSAMAAGVRWRL